jgi:signal peptidase II
MARSRPDLRSKTRSPIVWFGLAILIIVIDQVTKFFALELIRYGQRLPVISGWFDLTLVYNTGAAFSFLAKAGGWQRWFFIGIGLVASLFIIWMLVRHAAQTMFSLGLSLILGGALGNVIDRLVHGKVVDFLLVYRDPWYWPAFNAADSAITVGATLLILDEFRRVRRSR